MLEVIRQYNLTDRVKPEAESGTSRLFNWHTLVNTFVKMTRLAWPAAGTKPDTLDHLMESLKVETRDEKMARL